MDATTGTPWAFKTFSSYVLLKNQEFVNPVRLRSPAFNQGGASPLLHSPHSLTSFRAMEPRRPHAPPRRHRLTTYPP